MNYKNPYSNLKFLEFVINDLVNLIKKAAPRFELGIKDLQSSALPLGHAAENDINIPTFDLNSKQQNCLLIISNGHGEDVIALEIIKKLLKYKKYNMIEVLPLVGDGYHFDSLIDKRFKKIGYLRVLPSGGFSNQSFKGFLLDLHSGMLIDLFKNWLIIRRKSRKTYKLLAIGDLLPLFFAWSSKCQFAFMGTPKSDYTWSSGPGWSITDFYHKLKGSEWDPWELMLMKANRCQIVIMRDEITAINLKKKNINAKYFGNPMMDFVLHKQIPIKSNFNSQKIILLIGSRYPESINNLNNFLSSLSSFNHTKKLIFLVPLTINLNVKEIKQILIRYNFNEDKKENFLIGEESIWRKKNNFLLIGRNTFNKWANLADIGLSNAGTATEQIAGLGIPSLSIPGKGPQFTQSFAKRQERLLGGSVVVCKDKISLIKRLNILLNNEKIRKSQAQIGIERMGSKGASQKIVDYLNRKL